MDKYFDWVPFSCLKATEGGMSKKDTLRLLKDNDIRCKDGGYTIYVGHYSILVHPADREKASKLLWG